MPIGYITLSLSENDLSSAGTESVGCDLMKTNTLLAESPFFSQDIPRFLFLFLEFSPTVFVTFYSNYEI